MGALLSLQVYAAGKTAFAADEKPQAQENDEQGLEKTIDWYLSNEEWLKNVTSGDYQSYYEKQYQ